MSEDFWSRVLIGEPDACWLWTGANARGYGSFGGRRATHIAWELAHGEPFPIGKIAMHRCDNPPCVNPAHLVAGTHADNVADCIAKGRARHVQGEDHPRARVTEQQVIELLRQRTTMRTTYAELAAKFGLSHQQVEGICAGRTWRHLSEPLPPVPTELSCEWCGTSFTPTPAHRQRFCSERHKHAARRARKRAAAL